MGKRWPSAFDFARASSLCCCSNCSAARGLLKDLRSRLPARSRQSATYLPPVSYIAEALSECVLRPGCRLWTPVDTSENAGNPHGTLGFALKGLYCEDPGIRVNVLRTAVSSHT